MSADLSPAPTGTAAEAAPSDLTPPDLTLRAFSEPRPDRRTRRAQGKAQRAAVPLAAHSALGLAPERDPLAVLAAQDDVREPALLALRYERMAASPFAFLRGAAAVMAADLGGGPRTALDVQLCGDAHVANFGIFAAPDRRQVFDLNDFDETFPGPFEWDVKRLAASVVVAGRHVGVKPKKTRAAARAAGASYRATIARLSQLSPLETWYARVDVSRLIKELKGSPLLADARRARAESAHGTGDVALGKLTEVVDGERRFRARPPLLVPVDAGDDPHLTADLAHMFGEYLGTLRADAVLLLLRYGYSALAHKVVGVGSVGTRALVLLMVDGDGRHLVLQIKQANPSVLAGPLGHAGGDVAHHGQRVVRGQRLMQATGDVLLGWTTGGPRAPYDFFVRQLKDMKGGIDLERLTPADLPVYARICGAVLARAHARAGGSAAIAGYLGGSEEFDVAVGDFAHAYADLTERDHAALVSRMKAAGVG